MQPSERVVQSGACREGLARVRHCPVLMEQKRSLTRMVTALISCAWAYFFNFFKCVLVLDSLNDIYKVVIHAVVVQNETTDMNAHAHQNAYA